MEAHNFFLTLAVLLLAARFLSELAIRIGVPAVIGELAAGLIIGPSLLGLVSPDATMKLLAEIGIILLLFEVGMDTDVFRLAKAGSKPIVVAIAGVVFPFGFGYLVSHAMFGMSLLASLFIGGTLTATSIGITVRVLTDLGRRNSDEAQIVIGAAVLDDIVGVILLAFLYQFAVSGEMSLAATGKVGAYIVLFMLLSPFAAKFMAFIIGHFERRSSSPGLLLTMALSLIMLFSYLAHAIGAPEIMGGFAAGIAMGQHFRVTLTERLRIPFSAYLNRIFAPSPELSHRLESQMRPLIHTFTPLFFVMVGVSLNLKQVDWSSAFVWGLSAALLVVAVAGKLVSGFLIKEPRLQQTVIGLSMIPRGEVGLIFAQIGFANGILDAQVYAALLIVIALTTVVPPFIIKWIYQRNDTATAIDTQVSK
ncbi:cation:proton antiporter [Sulfuriferula sp. GW1]|uniref:cation:proton antiporter n=1 Tax=Sulfuriferula sp. GW1 TaxID=3345111 RepID=UPI0039B0EDCB